MQANQQHVASISPAVHRVLAFANKWTTPNRETVRGSNFFKEVARPVVPVAQARKELERLAKTRGCVLSVFQYANDEALFSVTVPNVVAPQKAFFADEDSVKVKAFLLGLPKVEQELLAA